MAETLRRLANIGTFSTLQDKLENWLNVYYLNTCDQNVNRCCEIIELNNRIQSQLYKLLNLTAAEGGVYGGASVIKSRLLPLLSNGTYSSADLSLSASIQLAKEREINDIQDMYESSLKALEADLADSRAEAEDFKNRLDAAERDLEVSRRKSETEKYYTEAEVNDLRARIRSLEDELSAVRARSELVDSYERQIRRLNDDLNLLSVRRDLSLADPAPIRPLSPAPRSLSLSRCASPLDADDVTQRVRQQTLITRFNDMFAIDRLDALDILRRYSDDFENNQRIVFAVIQEAFTAAKLAFPSFKMRVRSSLAITHSGPETLEEAVQDYINRNSDLADLPGLVADVIRALNRNPRIFLPPEISYSVIQPFIREACKLAWNVTSLAHPLDIAVATDGELFEDRKYRRSYDSDWSAALVNHHIWPTLMQGYKIIMKGEACTRRGASMIARGRSSSRPTSPLLRSSSRSPSRLRSRSPSPRRSARGSRAASPTRSGIY